MTKRGLRRQRAVERTTLSDMDIVLHPIGYIHCGEYGSREDSWGEIVSETLLDEKIFAPDALEGLTEFSHVEVFLYPHA